MPRQPRIGNGCASRSLILEEKSFPCDEMMSQTIMSQNIQKPRIKNASAMRSDCLDLVGSFLSQFLIG